MLLLLLADLVAALVTAGEEQHPPLTGTRAALPRSPIHHTLVADQQLPGLCGCARSSLLNLTSFGGASIAVSGRHRDPSNRMRRDTGPMNVQLRVSESVRPGAAAAVDELGAEHIAIEGVRPVPVRDMDDALIKLRLHSA